MQSSSSILEFPHSTSKIASGTFMKQQKPDKITIPTTIPTTSESETPSSGVTTNFFYKLSEIVAYTSTSLSALNTFIGGTPEPEHPARKRNSKSYHDDVMQINDDSDGAYFDNDETSEGEIDYNNDEKIDKRVDRKDNAKWSVNDDEEEPPPPYDNSWVLPKTNSGENSRSTSPKRTSFENSNVENKPTSTSENTNSTTVSQASPRRRQIRVRRPRRLLRRKSTEASTPRGGGKYDDPEQLLLKVNDKLSDMIAQGRAALTSTVDVTEVEMLLAEERERDERIAKEIGLQTPVGRKGRKNAVDYDYTDGNYSSPEYFDYGFGTYSGHGSGFTSPSGYDSPTYTSHGHYNTPSQFGSPSPGTPYHQSQAGFNYSNLGYKFSENEFNSIPNQYYGQSSNGYSEPAIPKGFGAGPLSGGFGAKFGRYGSNSNNGGFGSYGHNFGSNVGGFGSSVFGSNSGYRTNGMYNNLY